METAPPPTVDSGLPSPPRIITQQCTGCGRCVAACPLHLMTLEVSGYRKHATLTDPRRCTTCGRCVEACPVGGVTGENR